VRRIPLSDPKAQPTFEPYGRVMRMVDGKIAEKTLHIARLLEVPSANECTPLALLDTGEAAVMGVIVSSPPELTIILTNSQRGPLGGADATGPDARPRHEMRAIHCRSLPSRHANSH